MDTVQTHVEDMAMENDQEIHMFLTVVDGRRLAERLNRLEGRETVRLDFVTYRAYAYYVVGSR